VKVGERVTVDVTVNAVNPAGSSYRGQVRLYLTSNSYGAARNTEWDNYHMSFFAGEGVNGIINTSYKYNGTGFGTFLSPTTPSRRSDRPRDGKLSE
jgi:hypothetical protein